MGTVKQIYDARLVRRVKDAREQAGLSQQEVAERLALEVVNYKRFEVDEPLPHYLIEAFCRVTRIPIDLLITGRDPRRFYDNPIAAIRPAKE